MLTVTYDELAEALAASNAPAGAAEAHGSLCGTLAAAARFDLDTWVGAILPDDRGDDDTLRTRNLLATLAEETQVALTSQDMDFEPLLPDDAQPLLRRVEALAEWCAGFLYGVGTACLSPEDGAVPAAVHEVVSDFGEISRASIDSEESEESNEASYTEIVEYLRAGTQLAYEELEAHRAGGPR
jgi:uncharacterized protein YgfB (UPF0149 family)